MNWKKLRAELFFPAARSGRAPKVAGCREAVPVSPGQRDSGADRCDPERAGDREPASAEVETAAVRAGRAIYIRRDNKITGRAEARDLECTKNCILSPYIPLFWLLSPTPPPPPTLLGRSPLVPAAFLLLRRALYPVSSASTVVNGARRCLAPWRKPINTARRRDVFIF